MAEKVELATAYLTMVPSLRGANEELRKQLNPAMAAGIGAGVGTILGSAIGRGMNAVGSIIPDAIQAGGELEQSVGAIDTVFKAGAGSMHDWAASAATDVGLTKNEYSTLGTLIGSQLKNGGTAMDELAPKTKELIGTGADLASMFGGTTQDAVAALSSALKGERDPIERYGVSLNQAKIDAEAAALGFKKVGGSWSGQATQAATLSLIMKQTADAHGNFARESDTVAHKQQVLQATMGNAAATLGTALLPIMSAALPIIQGMADRAGPLAEVIGHGLTQGFQWLATTLPGVIGFVQQFSGVFIGLGVAIGAVAAVTGVHAAVMAIQSGAMLTAIMNMGIVRAATSAWTAIQWVLNAALSANPIGLVVILIAGLIAAVVWAYNNVGWFKDGVNTAWRVISSVTMTVLGAVGNFFRAVWTGAIGFGRAVIGGFVGFIVGSWNNARAMTAAVLGAAGAALRFVWSGAVAFGRAVIGGFVGFIVGSWSNISGTTRAVFSGIQGFIGGIWGGIRSGASAAINGVIGFFAGMPGRITGAIGNLGGLLLNVGGQIIGGLQRGIEGALGGLGDVLGNVGKFIADHKGPEDYDRRLLTPHGGWIIGGLAKSLADNAGLLEPPLGALADRIAGQTFDTTAGAVGRGRQRSTLGDGRAPAQITVMTNDPETAAELMARKLVRAGQG
jgi:hypothetical protein